jgi:hypothetical protein
LHVWDFSPDGTQERYEFVYGCKNRFGFEIVIAVRLSQDSTCSVEQCSSRAVRFGRVLLSNVQTKVCSFGRSSRELGPLDCENELSKATDSMLLMRVEDNSVAELAKSEHRVLSGSEFL